jgi:prevent-host-death family protein
MTVIPLTDARNRLSELIEEVERTHERIEITRHGNPVAVLISPDDLAALEETLDVLSSPEAMRQLAESRAAAAAGDVLDADQLAALLAQRAQPHTDRRASPPTRAHTSSASPDRPPSPSPDGSRRRSPRRCTSS